MDGYNYKLSLGESLPSTPKLEAAPKSHHSDQQVKGPNNLLSRVGIDRTYQRELPEAPSSILELELKENGTNATEQVNVADLMIKEAINELQDGNDMTTDEFFKNIHSSIKKYNVNYIQNIEAVLKKYPNGVDINVLSKHNDSIRTEAMNLLDKEINSEVRKLVKNCQEVFQSHIDRYWMKTVEKNANRIMETEEREVRHMKENGAREVSYETSKNWKLSKLESEINEILLKSKLKFDQDIEAVLRQHVSDMGKGVLIKVNDTIKIEPLLTPEEVAQNLHELEFKKKNQEEKLTAQKIERERKKEVAMAMKKLQEEKWRKEQEKEKKEEDKRREEEGARSVMIECFNTAVTQIQQLFPGSMKLWINQHLNISTLNQFDTVYVHVFYSTIEEHRQAVNPKLWNEFVSHVDNHCKKECILLLRSISEPVLQLNRALKKQFDIHGYFNASKLDKIFREEFQKLNIPQVEFISQMIKEATDKLLVIYLEHNKIIDDEETNNFKIASCQLENLYHEQMKRYMQDAPYSPQKLDKIHRKLVEKLADAFRKACNLSNTVNSFIGTIEDPLKEALENGYKLYETSNETKLRKLQIEINKIISKSKMKYTENIEAVLKQYPDGVEMRVLTKHNESIRAEAMKLLEMEIRSKVREDEPVENHQKVLQSHIDSYWQAVINANRKNFERKKERDEEEQRQQNKAEAQRKLQQEKTFFK